MKPFICNGDFTLRIGNNKDIARKALMSLHMMGFKWASGEGEGANSFRILDEAIHAYGDRTCLVAYRKEKAIYYGGDSSWKEQLLRGFTYDEFRKEMEEC